VTCGAIGFKFLASIQLSWTEAYYNSIMIVTTMGPTYSAVQTPEIVFTSFFALASIQFAVVLYALLFGPLIKYLADSLMSSEEKNMVPSLLRVLERIEGSPASPPPYVRPGRQD
jgi:hypothetical protein